MLNLSNKSVIKSCIPLLAEFYSAYKKNYIDLFFYEKDLAFSEIDLSPLIESGIIRKIKGKFRANVQVFPLNGKFICTDFNYSLHRKIGNTFKTQPDGVWGILPEESPIIAKSAMVMKGDFVLDLATGSGIIAIFCADKAKKVIATDINPRAMIFARFNSILNGVEEKIDFRVGDLFQPVKGLKFDLIIWNGPTVSMPDVPEKYPIYSFGGKDGAEFTKRFINEALNYLKPQGRLQWYDSAVGTKTLPVSVKTIIDRWSKERVKVTYNSLTRVPLSLKKSFTSYAKWNMEQASFRTPLAYKEVTKREEKDWHDWLEKHKYTHFFFGIISATFENKFSLEVKFPKKDIRKDRYLTRYWLWMSYPTLLKRLRRCEHYAGNFLN